MRPVVLALVLTAGTAVAYRVVTDERDDTDPADSAIALCRDAVQDQLSAPSTAVFGGESVTESDDHYSVVGYVDAGAAATRTDWSCEATFTDRRGWDVRATLTE